MKKIVLLILFISTYLFASMPKEVLLLHSYHKGYKWTDDISKTIEKHLKKQKNIDLTIIYMDTKKIATKKYLDELPVLYKEQFSTRKFDLIITCDNAAFDLITKNYNSIFKDTPVLFCGVNSFNDSMIPQSLKEKISGVVEQVDIEKNFQLILRLNPNLKKLVIINDRSKTANEVKKDLMPVIEKYEDKIYIEYIDNMDMKNIQRKVSHLNKEDSAILFLLLFKDKAGKHFTYKQSFLKIKKVSDVPIYGLWDFYMNYGMLGGLITSAKAQGEAVSQMAIDILNGVKVNQIPILKKSPNRYIFDYNELKRFDIDTSAIKHDYETINIPKSFYQEYTKFFVISISSIIILLIIILTMRANIQKRKKIQKELSNQLKFEKVLLNTLPNAIYYKDKDGKFLGCNNEFSKLVNTDKEDIIGKTAFDFFPLEVAQKNSVIDREILKNYGKNTSEFAINFPNQHMKYFIISKSIYLNIDGSIGGIVCIMDDISERIQQKQFIVQQSKLAEMGDMVAAIAHQWNEPLIELSALVQDIQTSAMIDELYKVNIEEFVNDSMVQIKYMSKTLSDFRNFLKPSTKKVLFSIKNSFDEIFEIIGKQIFYSNIELILNYEDKNSDYFIFGYENEFKQVLLNIINNAKNKIIENAKDMQEKGIITINISTSKKYSKIEIIDNAGKISKNVMGSIFNPYFTTKKHGTGLGLYMAKVIIEDKMQGQIYVKNIAKDSVMFTIKIPLNTVQES